MWAAYVLLKQADRPRWLPAFLGLLSYQLALGAKEVALCLPVLLIADWLFLNCNRTSLLRFALVLPQTLWYVFRKFFGPSAMTANGGYSLEITPVRAAENLISYTRWATDFLIDEPSIQLILLLAAVPLILAALFRDKRPLLGWVVLLFYTALLLFPLHRNLYVFFAAMPALAFCILPVVDRLVRLHKHAWLVLAALSLCTLFAWDRNSGAKYRPAIEALSQSTIQVLASPALASLQVPRSGLVVVQDDPFPFDDYALQMLLSLKFNDPALAVVRLKFHPIPPGKTPDAVVNLGKAPPPANLAP